MKAILIIIFIISTSTTKQKLKRKRKLLSKNMKGLIGGAAAAAAAGLAIAAGILMGKRIRGQQKLEIYELKQELLKKETEYKFLKGIKDAKYREVLELFSNVNLEMKAMEEVVNKLKDMKTTLLRFIKEQIAGSEGNEASDNDESLLAAENMLEEMKQRDEELKAKLAEMEGFDENYNDNVTTDINKINEEDSRVSDNDQPLPGAVDGVVDATVVGTVDDAKDITVNGAKDGAKDGTVDGAKDGIVDGAKDGAKDGIVDGSKDGAKDGTKDGVKDGTKDGAKKRAEDGVVDGAENKTVLGKFAVNDTEETTITTNTLEKKDLIKNEDIKHQDIESDKETDKKEEPVEELKKNDTNNDLSEIPKSNPQIEKKLPISQFRGLRDEINSANLAQLRDILSGLNMLTNSFISY